MYIQIHMSYLTRQEIEALSAGVFQSQLNTTSADEAQIRDESVTVALYQMQEAAVAGDTSLVLRFGTEDKSVPLQKYISVQYGVRFTRAQRLEWYDWMVTSVTTFRDALVASSKFNASNITVSANADALTAQITIVWR